jgi:hypothetical protein
MYLASSLRAIVSAVDRSAVDKIMDCWIQLMFRIRSAGLAWA